MKRILCLLVVLALTCPYLMSSALAAEDPRIVVSSVEAAPGDEIRLAVALVDNPGITNGKIGVTYDEAGLEFIRLDTDSPGAIAQGIMALNNGPLMNFVTVLDTTADFDLFYIHLKVKDDAAGDYRVGLTIHLMKNGDDEDVVFTLVEGVVSVKSQAGDPPATEPSDPPATDPGEAPTNPVIRPTVPGETLATKPGQQPTTPNQGQGQQEQPAPKGGIYAVVAAVLAGGAAVAVLIARKKRKS